jgi:hypothetical protein
MPADATQDICPANWRLPTGGAAGEFAWLDAKMNSPSATAPSTSYGHYENFQFDGAFRGVFSGAYGVSGWNNHGVAGYWWSSSHYESNPQSAHYLLLGSSYVIIGTGAAQRFNAFTVRCLAYTTTTDTNTYDTKPTVTIDGTTVDPGDIELVSNAVMRVKMPMRAAGNYQVTVALGGIQQGAETYEYYIPDTDGTCSDPAIDNRQECEGDSGMWTPSPNPTESKPEPGSEPELTQPTPPNTGWIAVENNVISIAVSLVALIIVVIFDTILIFRESRKEKSQDI